MNARTPLLALALIAVPSTALGHAKVTSPTPRIDASNIKEAAAPCGGPRGDVVTQLTGGQMLTLEYDETIGHPGFFQLRFSMAGDTNWQMIADNIPDQGGVGSYSYTFQVPDVSCDQCTFQWIQVMTDRNPPTNYYSCFDVEITSSTGTPTPDAGMGTADMGEPVPDVGMGTNNGIDPTNNGIGGTTGTGGNNGTTPGPGTNPPIVTPGADAGMSADGGPSVRATGTCATAPRDQRLGGWLIALLGLGLIRARRRSSRGSSEAR